MISSHTRTLAIIGDPIEHSITPRIQTFAWQQAGIDIVNVAFRVGAAHLKVAVEGARALGLLGLMVTIPHKEGVLELCDELDESARLMDAANLLHFHPDGRTIGYSSDGWAALKSLEEEGVEVKGAKVAMLGGGGAARSLALTFARAGVSEIMLLNRTVDRAVRIAEEARALGVAVQVQELSESTLRRTLETSTLLVNATSVGMHPHEDASPVPANVLHDGFAVYDIVYNPLETRLLREAKATGARTVDGLGMLIYTNVRAAQICAGHDLSPAVMREEALRALGERG